MSIQTVDDKLPECAVCTYKACERTPVWKLEICQFGISHVNDGEKIQKQNASVTLRHLSQNLRHELNKILQLIVNQVNEMDPAISLNNVSINSPPNRIVAATVMLDNFVEMITGVNDFQPGLYGNRSFEALGLAKVIRKYDRIYSLIRNPKLANDVRISLLVPETLKISSCSLVIEYLIAVLLDNIRKYALEAVVVRIYSTELSESGHVDVVFENASLEIREPEKIFNKGYQQFPDSSGFGFGLFWAKILVDHYNQILSNTYGQLQILHEQVPMDVDQGIYIQRFILKNVLASK